MSAGGLVAFIVGTAGAAVAATLWTAVVAVKALRDFSRTGPRIRQEIAAHYRGYGIWAFLRLTAWAWAVSFALAILGGTVYSALAVLWRVEPDGRLAVAAAGLALLGGTALQFSRHLLYLPSGIGASSNYRMSRFEGLWRRLSPGRLRAATAVAVLVVVGPVVVAVVALLSRGDRWGAAVHLAVPIAWAAVLLAAREAPAAPVAARAGGDDGRMSLLMIGCDTLRADRLGVEGYRRPLTPVIDGLAASGAYFADFHVPVGRTAPSLVTYLTGRWPHRTKVRDNFVGDGEAVLPKALPRRLAEAGYETSVVSDWAGSDFGKFDLGFERAEVPPDQWNLKYLIRQGPKDLRLFVSLFTHNRLGRRLLPELYYLAGVPLNHRLAAAATRRISAAARSGRPFFLNVFLSGCHPPFGTEFPYYRAYASPDYSGDSKFFMSRLVDPHEIIESQREGPEGFDLDHIVDLYDGAVRNFDACVGRIVRHLDECGLRESTVLVVYSDHGIDLFENGGWGQGNSVLSDHSHRVPLVIVDPRRRGGVTVRKIGRAVDLAPTLLELLGVPATETMDGRSLVPYLEGGDVDLGLAAYQETGLWLAPPPGLAPGHPTYPTLLELLEVPDKRTGTLAVRADLWGRILRAKDRAIRTERWKLVYEPADDGAHWRLFDVREDPLCRRDLAAIHPDVVARLRALLEDVLAEDIGAARDEPGRCSPMASRRRR